MSTIRITKEFTFEMAHALSGYDGKCANIHGHSYYLAVTVIGSPSQSVDDVKQGMVIDFSDLKRIVNEEVIDVFDHALVLNGADPLIQNIADMGTRIVRSSYQPTSENLLIDFAARISKRIPSPVKLHSLRLRETATSYAEWFASDN